MANLEVLMKGCKSALSDLLDESTKVGGDMETLVDRIVNHVENDPEQFTDGEKFNLSVIRMYASHVVRRVQESLK